MKLTTVVSALNSKTRLKILKILAEAPLTSREVFERLNVEIKCRESVYKALQKLVQANLVEKYYDKKKGVCYKLSKPKITIDLPKSAVIFNQNEEG